MASDRGTGVDGCGERGPKPITRGVASACNEVLRRVQRFDPVRDIGIGVCQWTRVASGAVQSGARNDDGVEELPGGLVASPDQPRRLGEIEA
jgi:hypothetical protein